jgi:hypothetical protein
MNIGRRKLILSLSAAAAATTTVFASGAFTRTETDRDFDLAIAPDDASLLAIVPSGVDSDVVALRDGVLSFETDGIGLNNNVTATLGRFATVDVDSPDELEEEAFLIRNNTQESADVTLGLAVETGTATLRFVLSPEDPSESTVTVPDDTVSADAGDDATLELAPGDALYGGVVIETTPDTTDVDAALEITAERV